MSPNTWYPLAWRTSARNWPSWPVIPVMRARGIEAGPCLRNEPPTLHGRRFSLRAPSGRTPRPLPCGARTMPSTSLVTVASRQHLPRVRVLAQSARAAGVNETVRAVIVDDPRLATTTAGPDTLELVPPLMVPASVLHHARVLAPSGPDLASLLTPWIADGLL